MNKEREQRFRFAGVTYFCPVCERKVPLLEPCSHIQIEADALDFLRHTHTGFDGDKLCLTCGKPWPCTDAAPARGIVVENCTIEASHALGELAVMGSDVATVFAAVDSGATFVITGPDPLMSTRAPRFGATLESHSAAREANASGESLIQVLAEIARQWRRL
jgi:hypothetical protein